MDRARARGDVRSLYRVCPVGKHERGLRGGHHVFLAIPATICCREFLERWDENLRADAILSVPSRSILLRVRTLCILRWFSADEYE